jgi:hypothetical protein
MFGLTFLSDENRKLLAKLESRLATATTPQLRNETQLAIQDLRNREVLLKECDLENAEALKSQLLNKINTLSGLGKAGSVEVFLMHLKDVEFHIQTLQMKIALDEKNKMAQPDQAPNLADKAPTVTSIEKEKKKQQTFGDHRWTIGFEDEPSGENK